jgi:hypothetical protein
MDSATATLTDVYDRWTVFDVNGDVWLSGFCRGLPDGKVKAFIAIKAEFI